MVVVEIVVDMVEVVVAAVVVGVERRSNFCIIGKRNVLPVVVEVEVVFSSSLTRIFSSEVGGR